MVRPGAVLSTWIDQGGASGLNKCEILGPAGYPIFGDLRVGFQKNGTKLA